MIRLDGVKLSFREKVIFKGISTLFGDRARVGLVGGNGAGKTTLLRVIAGVMEPNDGKVEVAPASLRVGYLPQDLAELSIAHADADVTVLDYLRDRAGVSAAFARLAELEERISASSSGGADSSEARAMLTAHERAQSDLSSMGGWEFDSTAKKILRGLGFTPGDEDRAVTEFSGGWKMRVLLAAVLVSRPDILLLDEPTNHLDSESMEWLEGWLRDFPGTMIFVSHDRRFLTKMSREVAELARGELTRWSMGYDEYVDARAAAETARERAIAAQREEIERTERFIERFRYKATKAAAVQSRIKRLEKMELIEPDAPPRSVKIRFPEAEPSGREVLTASGISKTYGEHTVYSGIDITIERGERVALVGVNGAGKSTLLRALCGEEKPDTGTVKLGYNVMLGHYSQESAQNLNYDHTIREEARRFGGTMDEARKRDLLGAFMFSGDDIEKSVRVLSGGEKSRLALFKLMLSDTNLLILDEPTNHLDMATRGVFQRALLEYGGTLVIVSHDRAFLDALATRVIEIHDGALTSYPGDYSEFIERRERARASAAPEVKAPAQRESDRPQSGYRDKRAEADRRNELYRARKVYADRIGPIEERIAAAEARIREIDAALSDPETSSRGDAIKELMIERSRVDEALTADYAEWEELSEAMENVRV